MTDARQTSETVGIPEMNIAPAIRLRTREIPGSLLPRPLEIDEDLGLAKFPGLAGQVVHVAHNKGKRVYEPRATKTASGSYLLMFPDGLHYGHGAVKCNDMLAYRSRDQGQTWQGPDIAFDIDYNQHGFIPLQPRGSERLYAFGTQPLWDLYSRADGLHENAPIGYRYSLDEGRSWSEVRLIRPQNDREFRGMSVMRMCETDQGTWLLGSHEGDWSYKPLITRQYLLRSEDQGQSWELIPDRRHGGWHAPPYGRMDEGRPLAAGAGEVYLLARTPSGQLWDSRSLDDGRTWRDFRPTRMINPDAPPMLFPLSDGQTWVNLHHNVHTEAVYQGLAGSMAGMKDRGQIWASLSQDFGRTWSEPGFLCSMARAPEYDIPFRNYQCSYLDGFADAPVLHMFMSQCWDRVLHLQIREDDLGHLPTAKELDL